MDPKKITELANLLRTNGDKILNSEFKLILSGFLLRALNDSFTLIADQSELCSPQSFQVVKPNNSKSDVFRDLQLVHDFVQKTILLCITQNAGDDYFDGVIDISKFRNLKRLEVQKTNVKLIIGIQPLRAQLQQLVCVRSLNCIEDIITHCGGDKSNGFVWNELKIADFSYNNLKTVDCSLEFAQYLQILNLSHNQLVSVEAIKWLPSLKTLDLSFNRLANIPSFHLETLKRLQLLNLSNNFIEDLSGISKLDSLNELDLSNNCLLDHTYLAPIAALITLKCLSLYGNPLQCHPKHRLATAQFLHKNTSTVEFILDMEPLSKNEKLATGNLTGYTSRYAQKSVSQTITELRSVNQTPVSSVGSVSSLKLLNESNACDSINSNTKLKKNPKVRMVLIEDKNLKTEDKTHPHSQSLKYNSLDKNLLEVNEDHLNAKKQIEDLRDKFGVGWLRNENAPNMFFPNTPNFSLSTSKQATQHFFDDLNEELKASEASQIENTLQTLNSVIKENDATVNVKQSIPMIVEKEETSYVCNVKDSDYFTKTFDEINSKYQDDDSNLLDIYSNNLDREEGLSEAENNEITYIVHQQNNNQELFLVVSDTSIKEKDVLTKRTKTKWSLKILESCECISLNMLRINFDTVKNDRKERVYTVVEENLCKKLENYLKGILSQRALSEMNQMLFRCVNCSCQFSREIKKQRKNLEIRCPDCKSTFIVESNDVHLQTKEEKPLFLTCNKHKEEKLDTHKNIIRKSTKITQNVETTSSDKNICIDEHSPQNSIGSATSLNESSSCSKITSNSDSSVDSNQSVAGSSSNERELYAKNCDSDVEIISNPSVSSIEVLENSSSRKTSEERRLPQIPNLATIYDGIENISVQSEKDNINLRKFDFDVLPLDFIVEKKTLPSHINLTESSSSGSVTDSICTAYEQEDKSAELTSTVESKRATTIDQSIISSMLGLFTSTNMLMSKQKTSASSQLLKEPACEKYKFNNIDFNDVDHRLKLYFYQIKFNDENEHLKWLVKGQIYYQSTSQLYNSIVALSTSKLYLFEIYASENDDVGKWLREIFSISVNQINCIQLLPWNIGVSIQLKDVSEFILILQDNLQTDTLLQFLEKNNLPNGVTINNQPSDNISKKLNNSSGAHQINILSVLNHCEIVATDNSSKMYSPSIIFTTNNSIYLTSSNFSWLSKYSGTCIELSSTQLMINVVDVENKEPNQISLFFLDETHNTKEIWRCEFETQDNTESFAIAIGQSWETFFGVPLFR